MPKPKTRAPRNRTMTLTDADRANYRPRLLTLSAPASLSVVRNKTLCQDTFSALDFLPAQSIDLLFADPPYNLTKTFQGRKFTQTTLDDYETWLETWVKKLPHLLKPTASIYICGDWRSSAAIHRVMARYFSVQNRITWEREKGRGAKRNWKNSSEDIWFGTLGNDFTFNVDAVKLKRRVIAPYKTESGIPKDWSDDKSGRFRLTHPSNLWTDISVPFWSMPENTEHPTQKPEKLLAKIILASSNIGDVVFDPFAGVGTTAVTAKKLGRDFIDVEIDEDYCLLAEKRLAQADTETRIQGYVDGVFWERNARMTKNE